MKGRNDLLLNEATMIEVLQSWLNTEMANPPRVVGVKAKSQHPNIPEFVIELDSPSFDGARENK